MRATLETTRRFYVRHPGWLLAQLGLVLVSLIIGIAGFFFSVLALIGIAVGVGLALLGIFVVPGWRDRVEERRLNS